LLQEEQIVGRPKDVLKTASDVKGDVPAVVCFEEEEDDDDWTP
jgi:hypothetical protein